eukprot:g33055.t1
MALQAALEAFRVGQHDVLTKFVANYEGKSLDLSSNNLGDVGASAVAKGLQVNNTLQTLDLYNNNIGPDGAKAIGKALEENKECKLEKLDISSNSIGAEGARHIAKALEVNPILKQLSGVELKDHIQGLPQGVSNNEKILEYLRQSKIKQVQEE